MNKVRESKKIRQLRKKTGTKKQLRKLYAARRVRESGDTGTRSMKSRRDYTRRWSPEDYE